MKKKKGFTLTEILGVLVILGLLLLLIVPTVLNKVRVSEGDTKSTQEKMIEESTNLYMDSDKDKYPNTEGNTYCIPIQTLIDNGKITEDLKDVTSKDPKLKEKVVKVTIDKNGVRKFKIVDSDSSCSEIKYKHITFEVGPKDNSQWSQSKYVVINYPDMGSGYVNKYSIDGGKTWKLVSGNKKQTENFTAPGKVMARMEGPTIVKDEYPVLKIDNDLPTCSLSASGTKGDNGWYTGNVTTTLSKSDKTSGVNRFGVSTATTPTYNSQTTGTLSSDSKGTTFYGYVEDKAGNVNKCSVNVNRDATKPSISNVSNSGGGNWTKNNVTISANASDATSGMNNIKYSYSSDGSSPLNDWDAGSSATYVKGTWSASRNNTVYLVATDNAGNQNIYNAGAIRIDKTPPYSPKVTGVDKQGTMNNVTDNCTGKGGTLSDTYCDFYFSTGHYSWYDFSFLRQYADSGSGIQTEDYQISWNHNGTAPKYGWTDSAGRANWSWKADGSGYNGATWITMGIRSIDKVGNVGYATYIQIHISY